MARGGVAVLALALAAPAVGKSATATFADAGVTGTVVFAQTASTDPVTVTVALEGLAENAGKYHVHALPLMAAANGMGDACSAAAVGGHYNPTGVTGGAGVAGTYACDYATTPASCEAGDLSGKHGVLDGLSSTTSWTAFSDAGSGLTLFGADSVVGRSVVIHAADGSRWVCATIREDGVTYKEVTTTFSGAVSGTVTFGQDASDPAAETWAVVRLSSSPPSTGHKWHVHENPLAAAGDCVSAGGHYNPTGAAGGAGVAGTYLCSPTALGGCEVGDLSGKHGSLDVPGQYLFTDGSLPLSGPNSVDGRSIVIHAADGGGPRLACANTGAATPGTQKRATATFASAGVTGTVGFAQTASTDPVTVTIALEGLDGKAGKYHVHALPLLSTRSGEGDACSAGAIGGHYNPTGVAGGAGVAGTYACDYATTPASCEAGDLSGKHGVLDGLNSTTSWTAFSDAGSGLTLFGADSVVGRSVLIHAADGSRWVCATIREDGVTYKEVTTTFSGAVSGTVTFGQDASDPAAETWAVVRLSSSPPSTGHKWHVHENPLAAAGDCASAGGHYNPTGVAGGSGIPGAYVCSPTALGGCEVGDLSGKYGSLDVPGQYLFTDGSLPLSGPNSVDGRSIVIHAADGGGPRLACASMGVVDPSAEKHATATFASAGVTGTVGFAQGADGAPVSITVALEGLDGKAGKYHVHALPLLSTRSGEGDACSAGAIGGHYNPTGVTGGAGVAGTYACDYATTPASCEAGDLSGKHGVLDGLNSTTSWTAFSDAGSGLTLFGADSVVGRSVVIHAADGSRWVCATIREHGVTYKEVTTTFSGAVSGTVTFGQDASDPAAETWAVVRLSSSPPSTGHKWHVHENPLAAAGDCVSAGGHYNPTGAAGGAGVAGTYLCSPTALGGCEVGDLSGKHGSLDVPGQYLFTDGSLPLSGPNSVDGRSIVIHGTDGGRLTCADVKAAPDGAGMPFWDAAERRTLDIIVVVFASLSLIGSAAIVAAYVQFQLTSMTMKLLLVLSAADILSDVVAIAGVAAGDAGGCGALGFLTTWLDLPPVLLTLCMSTTLYYSVFVKPSKRHDADGEEEEEGADRQRRQNRMVNVVAASIIFSFVCPLILAAIGAGQGYYGPVAFGFCWIQDAGMRFTFFYVPLWATILTNTGVYSMVWWTYRQAMKERHGVLGETRTTSSAHRLKYYPAVLVLTWGFATINRIYESSTGGYSFPLTVLHYAFCRSQGLFNFIVYGTDPRQRLPCTGGDAMSFGEDSVPMNNINDGQWGPGAQTAVPTDSPDDYDFQQRSSSKYKEIDSAE